MKPEILIVAASICALTAICLSQLKFVQADENKNDIHPGNIMSSPLDAEEKNICGKNSNWWCQLLGLTSTSTPSSTHRVISPREKRDNPLGQDICKPICRCAPTCKNKYCTCKTFCSKDAVDAPHTHPCICNDKFDKGIILDTMPSDESSNNGTTTTTPSPGPPSCSCRARCVTYSYTENNFCYIRVRSGSKNPTPKCECYYKTNNASKFTCDCYGSST